VQLTEAPAGMREEHVRCLREHGFDDVAIHDAIQVVSYFNYINRIADAVHVDLEPEMAPYPD
jgi:alkylhydroperoxidase family enzyme